MAGNLSGSDLTKLYNSPVHHAERVERKLSSSSALVGPFGHSGVKVTLQDKSQWLVHKGPGYGKSSQTVVTSAGNMSSGWKGIGQKDFQGAKTVGDFVRVGGPNYDLLSDNCHQASGRMMKQ